MLNTHDDTLYLRVFIAYLFVILKQAVFIFIFLLFLYVNGQEMAIKPWR